MRLITITVLAAGACACASYDPAAYDEDAFEAASSANPLDRGTEFLRQIRNAEIEQEKARSGTEKKTPRLFRKQKSEDESAERDT